MAVLGTFLYWCLAVLSHPSMFQFWQELLQRARGGRAYGCASQAMTMVATGALDVHVDLRGRLTPENFLAAALILEESGGCVVTTDGQPLHRVDSLISKTNLIAAATAELAQEIVGALVE